MSVEALVAIINADAEANRLFWVAGLARETWRILLPHAEDLHPVAKMAVAHYAESAEIPK